MTTNSASDVTLPTMQQANINPTLSQLPSFDQSVVGADDGSCLQPIADATLLADRGAGDGGSEVGGRTRHADRQSDACHRAGARRHRSADDPAGPADLWRSRADLPLRAASLSDRHGPAEPAL